MKKTLLIVLAIVLVMTPLAGAATVDQRLNSAAPANEIRAKEMHLQEFLDLLQQFSGIPLLAVPEVSEMKINLSVGAGQTVASVLELLRQKYGLAHKMNNARSAIIVFRGPDSFGRSYGLKMMPHLAAVENYRMPSAAAPFLTTVRPPQWNTEGYNYRQDNQFHDVRTVPLSTFSVDVDTASYSNVRRFLNNGQLPPADAVRTEELLNYFTYEYPQPVGEHPVSVTAEIGDNPWNPDRKLVLIGIQGKNIAAEKLPPSNLVFLIDVSGSMWAQNKLPLLKTAFKMLVRQLRAEDRVAIVVYAGAAGLVLDSTPGNEQRKIIAKIDSLQAGGSTAGGEGIKLAYKVAGESFIEGGNNRVILATDGDFNVGASSEGELTRLISERRQDGIFLSVLGFGMGNIKDNKMEALADHGNGNYAYIDNAVEAKKVMVSQMAGTLFTIAKDVKIQVEFNPDKIRSYRLIGYENRVMADRDFNNDQKDAGDMGAGHSVTALYEIIPAGSSERLPAVDHLVYQKNQSVASHDWMLVKVRYKNPDEQGSILMTTRILPDSEKAASTSDNFRFAAAVAEYGMLLRNSEFKGRSSYEQALTLARGANGSDKNGYRSEFIKLLELSRILDSN